VEWKIALEAVWLILPAYIANSSAVILGGGTPIDFGKNWKGKRIFGSSKTWRGFFGGILAGTTAGIVMNALIPGTFGNGISSFLIIISLPMGALSGDLAESFVKRRLDKKSGEKWIIADQIDFLLGAFALSFLFSIALEHAGMADGNWFLQSFSVWHILFLLILTPALHYITNIAGYLAGLKEVPW